MNYSPVKVAPPPGFWEGACDDCTAHYREKAKDILFTAWNFACPTIDAWLIKYFKIAHEEGHQFDQYILLEDYTLHDERDDEDEE